MMKKGLRELFSAECLLPNILIHSFSDSEVHGGSKRVTFDIICNESFLLFVWIFHDSLHFTHSFLYV